MPFCYGWFAYALGVCEKDDMHLRLPDFKNEDPIFPSGISYRHCVNLV